MSKEVRKTIVKSHSRSADFGVDPDDKAPGMVLEESELEKQCIKNQDLLSVAEPYMDELFDILKQEDDHVIILTERDGVILKVLGKTADLEKAAQSNLKTGVNMNEKSVGTNAMGTAIRERQTVQVNGNEHYKKALKKWSCTATPIFDESHTIIGTLNITSLQKEVNPYICGLTQATAKAIENRIQNSNIQKRLYDAHQFAFSIMNHLSFGLIAMDLDGIIHWVNDTACRSFNIRRTQLIYKDASHVFDEWEEYKKKAQRTDQMLDEEGTFQAKTRRIKYIFNFYVIKDDYQKKIGYVVTFRPFSRMHSLLNKYGIQNEALSFDRMVYKSKKMARLVEYAKTIANTPSTILITGESGTGKEVFAQAIHQASERKNENFIAINCGAISSSLIESELFGYEEGAFTGAAKGGRPGKFELADKGTLFLDEIGEMPLEMQVKLLRVLQERVITRVGGNKPIPVDVRLIAATNRKLEFEVENQNFRQDLYYRLSVIPLHLPPLRERKTDIPVLYRFFLERKANKIDRPIPPTSKALLQRLLENDWPGNIRELENFAEKAVIFRGNMQHLFPDDKPQPQQDADEDFINFKNTDQLPSLESIEQHTIQKYLDHFEGNISKTAKALKIGRNTLYQKIEKYNISI